MAKNTSAVTVPAHIFQIGAFPGICVRTGVPTSERKSFTASRSSPLVILGLVFGVVGVVVLDLILRKKLAGSVPLEPNSGYSDRQKGGFYTLGAGGLLLVLAFLGPSGALLAWMIVAMFVLFIVGGGLILINHAPVNVEMDKNLTMITLNNVHPNFAAAVQTMMHQQMATPGQMYAPAYPGMMPPPGPVAVPPPFQVAPPMPASGYSGLPPAPATPVNAPTTPVPTTPAPPAAPIPPAPQVHADPFQS